MYINRQTDIIGIEKYEQIDRQVDDEGRQPEVRNLRPTVTLGLTNKKADYRKKRYINKETDWGTEYGTFGRAVDEFDVTGPGFKSNHWHYNYIEYL